MVNNKNKKLVSIIIPHYNSVEKCINLLKSIPDLDWMEVIIVDDNSEDDILKLITYVSTRSDEIKLLISNKKTKGAGIARNTGIKEAKGKWLLFADADDYFVKGWEQIITEYKYAREDIIYFPPTSLNLSTGKVGARHHHYEYLVKQYIKNPKRRNENELKYGFITSWSKLIKREIFIKNDVLFEEDIVANDLMAITRCAYFAKSIKADSRTIYCVTCGIKTLTKQNCNAYFDDRVDTKIKRYQFLKRNLNKKDFAQTNVEYYMAGSIVDAAMSNLKGNKLIEVLRKYHKNNVKWFSFSMISPRYLFHTIREDLKWRKEVNS